MRRWRATPIVLLVGVIVTLLAGCTAGPSNRPAIIDDGGVTGTTTPHRDRPRDLPPLGRPHDSTIAWTDCAAQTRAELPDTAPASGVEFACGQVLNLVRSPDQPGTLAVKLSLLKAGTGRVPLVVVNDVGGTPGTLYAAQLATHLPPAFLRTFSLIGMDRRGTGSSAGLHCVPQPVRAEVVGYDPDTIELSGLLEAARKATQQCELALDNNLQAFDSWNTAGDLERVRSALGVPRLNAIGHGEGSRVLTTYASRFPDRTGRIVLDGVPDPTADVQQRNRAKAAAAERTFDAFAADCLARKCPLAPNPRHAVTALLDSLRTEPLTARDGTVVTAGTVAHALLQALPFRRTWPALATALAGAATGKAGELATMVAPLLQGSADRGSRFDARMVTRCNDDATRLPPQKVVASVRDWRKAQPLFGGLFAHQLLLCLPWPAPSRQVPHSTGDDVPPLLVLSTAADPVTPGVGTRHAAQLLPTAVLVNWQGTGHGALPASGCATTAVKHFLIDGTVPTDGTVCPA